MSSIRLPYPFIADLPKTSQEQIWKDFEFLIRSLPSSPTIFDAIIDASLPASNTRTHQYVNLTELLAAETWDPGTTFNVGVRQDSVSPRISEPTSPISMTGKGDLSLFGLTQFESNVNNGWDWAAVTMDSTQQIYIENLTIRPGKTCS